MHGSYADNQITRGRAHFAGPYLVLYLFRRSFEARLMRDVLASMRLFARSDYYVLARFLIPLAFADAAVDIGEQVSRKDRSRRVYVYNVRLSLSLSMSEVTMTSCELLNSRLAS